MLFIFPALGILCALAWFIILGNPKYIKRKEDSSYKPKSLTILIPARNEEQNIGKLLESITKEKNKLDIPLQVIVIDDHSSDLTAKISNRLGATTIPAKPLPTGWKGKPWACHQGAEIATGEWLLFLDADTYFEPDGLKTLLTIIKDGATTHSICPHHFTQKPYEQLSAFFNVMMIAGSNNFSHPTNSPQKQTLLFGQSLLISKANYQSIEGHQAVKDKVLENVHLSEILHQKNLPQDNYLGKDILSMRMFPTNLTELSQSWKKGFVSGASAVPKKNLIYSSIWITGAMFTTVSIFVAILATFLATKIGFGNDLFLLTTLIAYLTFVAQTTLSFRMAGRFHALCPWVFPLLLIFYQYLFFTALIQSKRGKQTQWKGRDVS